MKASSEFNWERFVKYYNESNGESNQISFAPPELFTSSFPNTPNTFEINQKLEAIDPQNSDLFCVCTIVDKCGHRIKLHFDNYLSTYDFWVNADSENIFPAGWCSKTGRLIDWVHRGSNRQTAFDWIEYLKKTKSQAAHPACFKHVNRAVSEKKIRFIYKD